MDLDGLELEQRVEFEDAGERLGADLRESLERALASGATMSGGRTSIEVFRGGLAQAIGRISESPRAGLFLRFLRDGPYDGPGPFQRLAGSSYLDDEETARVLRFLCGHMVSCFQGFLAEALAAGALAKWLSHERAAGNLPETSRLFLGDSVLACKKDGHSAAKAADAHVLSTDSGAVILHALAEVKSYYPGREKVRAQLEAHLGRSRNGLRVEGVSFPGRSIQVSPNAIRLLVVPSRWTLPRSFRYEATPTGHQLHVDEGFPPTDEDKITRTGEQEFNIELRWSREALAAVAFDMTYWLMGEIGGAVWADQAPPWAEMSGYDAGQNAAKQMLYYALRRVDRPHDRDKAVALYNAYGFGYALGSSFRDCDGRRQILWPEDLVEILAHGKTTEVRSDGMLIRGECRFA